MRVFAATAMLLACLITTIQAAGGGKDGVGGKDDDSNCPCLDSIDLPNFQNQFIYKTGSIGPFTLSATYDKAVCRNVNFHIKLYDNLKGQASFGTIGCLVDPKNPNSNEASFQPDDGAKATGPGFVRGADGLNRCGINIENLCTTAAIADKRVFEIEITADKCSKRRSFSFTCVGSSTVSKSSSWRKRQEIALNIPPRHMRCSPKSQACRTGGSIKHCFRWRCLDTDQIDSCGGCPGDENAIDCTELPGISAVQCVAKRCIVAQCRPGYKMVDNMCIKDGTSTRVRRPQLVIVEKTHKKRERVLTPSRVRPRVHAYS